MKEHLTHTTSNSETKLHHELASQHPLQREISAHACTTPFWFPVSLSPCSSLP